MSRASKITLATTIVATTVTVIWVHKVQEEERNVSIFEQKEWNHLGLKVTNSKGFTSRSYKRCPKSTGESIKEETIGKSKRT